MRSPYPWISLSNYEKDQMGGKYYEHKKIIPLIPIHEWYVEPFFGSGIILLNKPKAEKEFANDLFSCLVCFWQVLQQAELAKKLQRRALRVLDSRYLYQMYMRQNPEELDMLDRAYRFLYLIKFGFNSFMDTYHTPITHKLKKVKNFAKTFKNTAKYMMKYQKRVEDVHFTNYDFRVCLEKVIPNKHKFIFLDPPYKDTHGYDRGYYEESESGDQMYEDMRDLLAEHTKGGTKWMITCNKINTFFDDMENVVIKYIDRRTCINTELKKRDVRTKVVMNYNPDEIPSCLYMNKPGMEDQGSVLGI